MIKICGDNKYFQFGEDKSNKVTEEGSCISPPSQFDLNISETLSFSTYSQHTVWITKDFIGHALGDNREGRISGSIPLEIQKQEKDFYLADSQGLPISIISAVCGNFYTLYLTKRQDGLHLGYVHKSQNDGVPLFLNINGRQPISIYGGWDTAAAIDEDGGIIVITESVFDDPLKHLSSHRLPHNEKVVKIACCNNSILVLSSTGRVFIASLSWDKTLSLFDEIIEFNSKNVVDISGSYKHFLVVTSAGKVFGCGENRFGQLGIGNKSDNEEKFVEITALKDKKITKVYAGDDHSLFQTDDGRIYACGKNNFGQLFLEKGPSEECTLLPAETSITKGAKFCIAGNGSSVVFIDTNPPENTPNMKKSKNQ